MSVSRREHIKHKNTIVLVLVAVIVAPKHFSYFLFFYLTILLKGIVQRKLRWVEIGINRQVLL